MNTERFKNLRKPIISNIFQKERIIYIWRNIVKNQLRSIEIKDIYDNYDINYNIEERALAIRNELINGNYKVSQPLIYRIEKKYGICRHIIIPQPTDALVLQIIIDYIADSILKNQPSAKAFFSRDRTTTNKPHEVSDYGLSWKEQWKEMQKEIYRFNEEKELIIVTDISNYYDSIDIKELRKVFSSYSKISEVIIDLIFRIIEEISWKPDYLPYSGRGLPTTNIEGVRLLAHTFLFEIDEVIKNKSNDSFTRWMDDITIGVNTKKEAIEIISSISDVLKSRGLSLNESKIEIYDSSQGYIQFQIEENRYIDSLEMLSINLLKSKEKIREIEQRFKKHLKKEKSRYWDKIIKRYINVFIRIRSKRLVKYIYKLYIEYPNIRVKIQQYLLEIGYNSKNMAIVILIMKNISIYDDLTLYQLCFLMTQWEIPIEEQSNQFIKEFDALITKFSFFRKEPLDFYCIIWFKTKYYYSNNLYDFIIKYQNLWNTNTFLRRQITSVFARLYTYNYQIPEILFNQISSGIINVVNVANQIIQFANIDKLDKKLNYYLFPRKPQKPYPLSKYLVLCSVLNSENIRKTNDISNKIKKSITDPYYLLMLKEIYGIDVINP